MLEATSLFAGLNFSNFPQQLVNGLLQGSVYALIALGYTMVYGVLRLINFAHGEVFMIGAYIALFVSWMAGFGTYGGRIATEEGILQPTTLLYIGLGVLILAALMVAIGWTLRNRMKRQTSLPLIGGSAFVVALVAVLISRFQPDAVNLFIMLIGAMAICSMIGVTIEFFAYRPLRSSPRLSALITAIGVSLFIQYGGQLFLPNSPPPAISEAVNPYQGTIDMRLRSATPEVQETFIMARDRDRSAREAWNEVSATADIMNLTPDEEAIREEFDEARSERREAEQALLDQQVEIRIPQGQVIMFCTAILLMLGLRYLVMFTPMGRAMRAVSHDYEAASLMGVNVNRVITFTFWIGSMLAGAAAMMSATFLGSSLTTFYGFLFGVKAFVSAVLGGIGNIPGAALGGFLLGMAETMVTWVGYSGYKDAVAFVILILVLLFRPGGLLGSSKVEKV